MENIMDIRIDISIIVPIYNVEEYLTICVDSLLKQQNVHIEIILVDDGSTDRSGAIADQYSQKDTRVKVIHQKNGEASAARNAGLDIAQGEYIAFVDSDDWLKENSLCELYHEAIRFQADVVMGKVEFGHTDGSMSYYKPVPDDMLNISFTGKECFIRLVKAWSYRPMVWNYIYRKSFLDEIQARFVVGVTPHEDELWTPVVICQASKIVMVDTEYYYYRQREQSVLYSTNFKKRLNAYIHVNNRLFEFADRYDFSGVDGELKNWLYVTIFNLYSWAFSHLPAIRDTTYMLPAHQLDRFWQDCWEMMPEPQRICYFYFCNVERALKTYIDWRMSDQVASIKYQWKSGKKMMLLFNFKQDFDLSLKLEDIPNDWVITTDRRFLQQADVVVFHLPNLGQELDKDLDKPNEQIWVGWCMESENNFPFLKDQEVRELFDLWMGYRQEDTDIFYPFYRYEYLNFLSRAFLMYPQQNKTLMILPIMIYEKDHHDYLENYLKKLKGHIEIDSIYIEWYNVNQMSMNSRTKKLDLYRNYKFVIVFENAIETDYVTEDFFDTLLADSVPIYLGAPNIEDFAPGDNCFVDIRKFESPQSLADFINACYDDEQLYEKFFEWKNKPLRKSFLMKIDEQKEHPLTKLCQKIDEIKKENSQ